MSRRVQNLVVIALALLLFSFHIRLKQQADPYQVGQMAKEVATPALWKGKTAPDFELALGDGKKFALAEHVGKEVIVLNFFATWCGPCRAETPELNRFAAASQGKPVLLIGIDGGEKPELVAKYVQELKVGYPVAIDSGEVSKLYGVKSFPTTVVIGAAGQVELYETGAIANADVAFSREVGEGLDAIASGKGISREVYLSRAKSETYYEVREAGSADDDTIKLTGRAKELAEKMTCVCGCSDTVMKCGCAVSKGMMKRLRDAKLDGTNDVEVMKQINAEFCMKGMS